MGVVTNWGSEYSLSYEPIPLDPAFPLFMFSYSVTQDPIRTLHCHDVFELGVCMRGNGVFVIGNRIRPYEAGDTIVIAPGVYHRAKSGEGVDDLWFFIHLQPHQWGSVSLSDETGSLIGRSLDPGLFPLLKYLVDEMTRRDVAYQASVRGLVAAVLVRLYRLQIRHPHDEAKRNVPLHAIDDRINRAIDKLITAEAQRLPIADLARECGLSEPHFRHLFKEQVGMSPKRFQTKLKINMAMNRLKDPTQRVVDVSEGCGFESLSSFNRQFKRETGLAPLQWRARNRD